MSLEICEVNTPEKLKLKSSIFFKNRIRLIIGPDTECKCTRISEDLYFKQQKYYFPIFEKIIFVKTSNDNQSQNLPLIFKGIFIHEDEIGMIKSLIKENIEKENIKYNKYKKTLDKEISEIIGSLSSEIDNQKKFLKKDYLTKQQYNENIKILLAAYLDIITIKLDKGVNLKNDDRNLINKFYGNMIEGLVSNNILIDVTDDLKESDFQDTEQKNKEF
ncbi:hypothetical protein LLG07_01085 [bacterium]|nr:hypothetical protein [bacterium]